MPSLPWRAASQIRTMAEAAFAEINRQCDRVRNDGNDLIDLGQAVPDFPPPPDLARTVSAALSEPAIHRYTADLGLPDLRQAVAEHLRTIYGARDVSGENIVVTAGANQAFQSACICLFEPGDHVGLLSPLFLNHQMAVQGCGGIPVEILPDDDFRYPPQMLREAVRRNQLRGLVVVNPSNPTGKVYSAEELTGLLDVCRECGIPLLCDEVYRAFVYGESRMTSIGSLPHGHEHALIFGSFSKEYGMTGWRLGWMCVPRALIPPLLKVQDYSLICAPHVSQIAALSVFRRHPDYAAKFRAEFDERRRVLTGRLQRSGLFEVYEAAGAQFLWSRPTAAMDTTRFTRELLDDKAVCIVPGSIFGESWSGWLRISFGSQPKARLLEAAERLLRFTELRSR